MSNAYTILVEDTARMLPPRRTRRRYRNFELGVRGCETDKTGSDPCLFLAFL